MQSKTCWDLSRLHNSVYTFSLSEYKAHSFQEPYGLALLYKINWECTYCSCREWDDVLLAWKNTAAAEGHGELKDGLSESERESLVKDTLGFKLSTFLSLKRNGIKYW